MAYDMERAVKEIPKDVFHKEFVQFLGCTNEFSKLRCGAEERLEEEEMETIRESFETLGLPSDLTMQEYVEAAYALTARAVLARS